MAIQSTKGFKTRFVTHQSHSAAYGFFTDKIFQYPQGYTELVQQHWFK